MAKELGLVYSRSSGVVTRFTNPDTDDWLDGEEAVLNPLLAMHRIPKAEVGADDRNCPTQEVLIDYVNNSKNPPKVVLRLAPNVAVLDAESTVVAIILGCPDILASVIVPRDKGSDHSTVVITDEKKPVLDIGAGNEVKALVMTGTKYDPDSGLFLATEDQLAAAAIEAQGANKVQAALQRGMP